MQIHSMKFDVFILSKYNLWSFHDKKICDYGTSSSSKLACKIWKELSKIYESHCLISKLGPSPYQSPRGLTLQSYRASSQLPS